MANLEETVVLYESPFRLIKTLEELKNVLEEDRQVCVCRELTKLYEETIRGTAAELLVHFSAKTVKGEIVIIVQGRV